MTAIQFMSIAQSAGYQIRFYGWGWAKIVLEANGGEVVITDGPVETIEDELMLIGMAISNDDVRRMVKEGRAHARSNE